jgi:hypothetical protein
MNHPPRTFHSVQITCFPEAILELPAMSRFRQVRLGGSSGRMTFLQHYLHLFQHRRIYGRCGSLGVIGELLHRWDCDSVGIEVVNREGRVRNGCGGQVSRSAGLEEREHDRRALGKQY